MPVPQLQTMDDLINRKTLYASYIDRSATKNEIKSDLQVVCQRELGSIVVPVDQEDGFTTLGVAYCNFKTNADAKEALQRCRFNTKVAGKLVSLTYSVINSKDRSKIFGAWGNRLTAFIKNLSPEVDEKLLCKNFEKFGEIFRCKVDVDSYGNKYGMVQYTSEKATRKAVELANDKTWYSTVIKVERHAKMLPGNGEVMTAIQQAGAIDNTPPPLASTGTILAPPHPPPPPPPGLPPIKIQSNEWRESPPPLPCPPLPSSRPSTVGAGVSDNRYRSPRSSTSSQHHLMARSMQDAISTISSSSQPSQEHIVTINGKDLVSFDTDATSSLAVQPSDVEISGASPRSIGGMERVAVRDTNVDVSPAPYGILGLMAEQRKWFSSTESCEDHANGGASVESGAPVHGKDATDRKSRQRSVAIEGAGLAAAAATPGAVPMSFTHAMCQLSSTAKTISALLGPLERVTGMFGGEGMLSCPITQEVFKDPVVAADGHTYERIAIEQWLQKSNTSPLTSLELPNTLTPNLLIKHIIEELNIR